jgi:UDP-N-acetylmuramate--alanine ligase
MKKIYVIWIGWIGISAIARYYNQNGYSVYGSDKTDTELVEKLKKEGIDIVIWEDETRIDSSFDLVVYTEAIPKIQSELKKSISLNLRVLTYPQALWEISNKKKLIAITWTHGKSTTTSLTSLILKDSDFDVNVVVWTVLKEFSGKNCFFSDSEFFVIEACEYKRSFLNYKPTVWVITNIEIDHLDYYKDLDDYISAFRDFLWNIIPWWFAILNWMDENCKKLLWLRNDINYIEVYEDYFSFKWEKFEFPKINMKIPWNHILYDAKIAYTVWHMIWINDYEIVDTLENYNWVWRRMEYLWKTKNWNILISDYGHHPTEISLTLKAIRQSNMDKKILTVFQPHQYNRTLELLEWFKTCFVDTDKLIIPNIYESRDTKEDKEKIDSKKLISYINHWDKIDWDWLDNTLKLILDYDRQWPQSSIIILLWAWDVDDLRFKIDTDL